MSAGIFISYRREDSPGHAGRLYDRLSEHFGDQQVFMDLTIEPGADFVQRIDDGVASCAVLIALIGDEWLSAEGEEDGRRLDDPRDFVRLEISSALDRGIPVIPVLVHDAEMPRPEELPADLDRLARRNAIELSDARWSYDVGRLIETIERVLHHPGSSVSRRAGRRRQRLRGRPMLIGLGALAAAGLAALAAVLLSGGGGDGGSATIAVGSGPDGIVTFRGDVWVVNSKDNSVSRVDAEEQKVTETVAVGPDPDSIAVVGGSLWVTNTGDGTISRIDPGSGRTARPMPAGRRPEGIAVAGGRAWVANAGDDAVTVIDARSNRRLAPIRVGTEPRDITAGDGFIWVTGREGTVRRIDPVTRQLAEVRVGGVLRGIRVEGGAVWVANVDDGTVVKIDSTSLKQRDAPIPVGAQPVGLALSRDSVWVGSSDGSLVEIDVREHRVEGEPIDVGERPIGVAVGEGAVWVANYGSGTVTRVGP